MDSRTSSLSCGLCGTPKSAEDLIRLREVWVCAGCKPAAIQQVREAGRVAGAAVAALGAQVWRELELIVLHREAALPDRCFKCNTPVRRGESVNFRLMFPRKLEVLRSSGEKAEPLTVAIPLCAWHTHAHRWSAVIGVGLIVLPLLTAAFGYTKGTSGFDFLIGFLLWMIGSPAGLFVMALWRVRPQPVSDDGTRLRMIGAGRPFLDSLPEGSHLPDNLP